MRKMRRKAGGFARAEGEGPAGADRILAPQRIGTARRGKEPVPMGVYATLLVMRRPAGENRPQDERGLDAPTHHCEAPHEGRRSAANSE